MLQHRQRKGFRVIQEIFRDRGGFSAAIVGLTGANENDEAMGSPAMMDEVSAAAAVARFDNSIQWAARLSSEAFPTITAYEDAVQDASILVLSYSGYGDTGRHFGKLRQMESDVDGDAGRLQNLMAEQLRADLCQDYGREAEKRVQTISIEALPESHHPAEYYEDRIIARIDNRRELIEEYPYLSKRFLTGATEYEISEATGIPLRTVERRIAEEKAKAEQDPNIVDLAEAAGWEDWKPAPEEFNPSFCACGNQFNVGGPNAVEHACSLSCWLKASQERFEVEKRYWDLQFGGYHKGADVFDPVNEFPELYRYKKWS